jgi:hypothetical protein
MYLGGQDDYELQPNYVYLPLLAHGSGIGGVGSSERLAKLQTRSISTRAATDKRLRLLFCSKEGI